MSGCHSRRNRVRRAAARCRGGVLMGKNHPAIASCSDRIVAAFDLAAVCRLPGRPARSHPQSDRRSAGVVVRDSQGRAGNPSGKATQRRHSSGCAHPRGCCVSDRPREGASHRQVIRSCACLCAIHCCACSHRKGAPRGGPLGGSNALPLLVRSRVQVNPASSQA